MNLARHGFYFADVGEVMDSRYRLDVPVLRKGESRMQSISYAMGFLAVLIVIYTERESARREISFRRASEKECEEFDVWLENEFNDA